MPSIFNTFLYVTDIEVRHCVQSVRIRSFSGTYFSTFGLNAERYGVEKLRIRTLFT